jgi:hypothetical protein
MIFTGNFLVICHCSADAAVPAPSGAMHRHCYCNDRLAAGSSAAAEHPCKDKNSCPGTQAVKFNLSEKQVAAAVHAGPLFATLITRDVMIPVLVGHAIAAQKYQQQDVSKHSPPDLLAFFHRFLI